MIEDRLIWILEDNDDCIFVYRKVLDLRYKTRYFSRLEELKTALLDLEEEQEELYPDLLIADLILPDGSFINWFKDLDIKARKMPFIVVSSVDDQDALFRCYGQGASDYLIKPFNKNELIVKTFNAIRRPIGKVSLTEDEKRELLHNSTPKERQILAIIFRNNGSASRDEIFKEVWNNVQVHPKTLDVHLTNIRKKLIEKEMTLQIQDGTWTLSTNGMCS